MKGKPRIYYRLNDAHEPVPCSDMTEWAQAFNGDRAVDRTELLGHVVSTVFLGMDHGYGERVLLFETMVFRGQSADDLYCQRFTTWAEAVDGHARAVAWVRSMVGDRAIELPSE